MKQTKKITVSAAAVALTVLFMALGAYIEVFDLTSAALCSIIMAFVFVEVGKPYTYLVWLGSSLLGFVFFSHSLVWITYFLVFGIYPILKAYIEKLKRPLWIPVKLLTFAASAGAIIFTSEVLLGIPFFEEDVTFPLFGENTVIFKIAIYLGLIVMLAVYDYFMTVMIRVYFSTVRKRIAHLLK